MKTELHNYDIYPKVFIVREAVEITIKPLGKHADFKGEYAVDVLSMAGGNPNVYLERKNITEYKAVVDNDGCIRITHTFMEESEHIIRISKEQKVIVALSVYALEEDMRGRYPYRGDLHIHTTCSDGKQAPAIVAANYRRHGYDFISITDHHRYYASLQAIDTYKDIPHELNIVCGEEIHLPGNDIHIVNFGGEYSVNCLIDSIADNLESRQRAVIDNPPPILKESQYIDEINELIEKLDIPDNVEKFTYASCVWACRHIYKGNGLSIFAHPYWKPGIYAPYHVPESLCEHIIQTNIFDAFEVSGCAGFRGNMIQEALYYQNQRKGIEYSIVGSTDSHDSIVEVNPSAYSTSTFVFARENERKALISAMKEKYSVVVNHISEEYRLIGECRLIKYTRFLIDEFSPLHDELCFEEGRLMKLYATGGNDGAKGLEFIYGRMKKLYDKYFLF